MIPAPFQYTRATSVEHAVQLLSEAQPGTRLLAGGHTLIPLMKRRMLQPPALIDIGGITELSAITEDGDTLVVGALATHAHIERSPVVARTLPLLSEAVTKVGDPQVRARGTLGGNLFHTDPAADLPAVLLATGATVVVSGPAGGRRLTGEEFFGQAVKPTEIVVSVRFPAMATGTGYAYEKVANRASGFPVVGVAVSVQLNVGGTVTHAGIGVIGATGRPTRAHQAEETLAGQRPDAEVVGVAARSVAGAVAVPVSDLHASGPYRLQLLQVTARRALERAIARVGSTDGP